MGEMTDKAKAAGNKLAGNVKEGIGKMTDNESLEAEGQRDQSKANVKQAGEKVKDAADDVKDAFKK